VVDNKHSNDYVLVVHVTFRLGRTWGVPIGAELSCPDSLEIVMRWWTASAQASVVESHATPLDIDAEVRRLPIMTEASSAYLDRLGFSFARWIAPLIKPGIWRTTRKLWVDDLVTAERRYESDQRSEFPG
jgi:Domain of unknown function (DUF5914)